MKSIPIYSTKGKKVDAVDLPTDVAYISGRVSLGEDGHYYKGLGVPYRNHHIEKPRGGYRIVGKSDIFYMGYTVVNPRWEGKHGIFLDTYQPMFSDIIGTCGPKELKLIRNARDFLATGVRVLDNIEFRPDMFYFQVEYIDNREPFLPDGNIFSLFMLLQYMLQEGWNMAWDKNFIGDVSRSGKIFDVADLFRSKHPVHRLGTVYALFYSLARHSPERYLELLKLIGLNEKHTDDTYTVLAVLRYLTDLGYSYIDVIPEEIEHDNDLLRWFMIGNVLIMGRNCAHQEFPDIGECVREQYRDKVFLNKKIADFRTELWDLGLGTICLE